MLTVRNLTTTPKILRNVSAVFRSGETVFIMGPNGSGKSTLARVIMGDPFFSLDKKSRILLGKTDITGLKPEARAKKGVFLSFQNPPSLVGVSTMTLLKELLKDKHGLVGARKYVEKCAKEINVPLDLLDRPLDTRLSGGERKKLEVVQALALVPRVLILDEIDTGLDSDAVRIVGRAIAKLQNGKPPFANATDGKRVIIVISHTTRLLPSLNPDNVMIMKGGRIVKTGGPDLAHHIEKHGYGR